MIQDRAVKADQPSAPTSSRRLVGVGVGPGDPQLLTLAAVRELEAADVILVPATEASEQGPGRAELIITAACKLNGELQRIPFAMRERRGVGPNRAAAWQLSAKAALDAYVAGAQSVAFATVGDPSVFSTFSYLAAHVLAQLPDVDVQVIPGITAMQALAARARTPLTEGQEVLCLYPHTAGSQRLGELLEVADTVVVYKGGREFGELADELRAHQRDAVIGTDVGTEREQLWHSLDELDAAKLPYFSTVLSAPKRTDIGGRL